MEIQQLRYIVTLSQELNFQQAARRVNVTQPTLSQQIKKAEESLGSSLFERSAHGVRLTEAGKKFVPYAIEVLDRLGQGISAVKEDAKEITGTIRIGAIPTIAPYLLPPVILTLKKKAPRLRLEIYEETTAVLTEHLKDGTLDLGILALPIDEASLISQPIGKEPFLLAVSKSHPLSKRKTISLKSIQNEKMLILQEGHCFADQALEYCQRNREDEQVIFQGSSLTSVMKLAETSEGITLVPQMAVESNNKTMLSFIPFSSPIPTREIGLMWRISTPLGRAHKAVMESVRTCFKKP